MIIDVHAHCAVKEYTEHVARVTGQRRAGETYPTAPGLITPPTSDDPADIESRLKFMDAADVRMQVLSQPGGGVFENEADAIEGARIINNRYAELVRQYPTRFAAYCVLPLPHVQASLRELQRALDDLGLVGVAMGCSILRTRSPAEEEFEPIYAELNRRGRPLYFHPSGNGICSPFITDFNLTYATGAPFEDTTLIAHLMARAIPARFPDVKIIVAHFGGAISMLTYRMDHEAPPRVKGLAEPPSATAKRLYYDTVGHGSPIALGAACRAFGADHLMAGSDYPITLYFEPYAANFSYFEQAELSEADAEKIRNGNAIKLFGLSV